MQSFFYLLDKTLDCDISTKYFDNNKSAVSVFQISFINKTNC